MEGEIPGAFAWLPDGGETGALVRSMDWSRSPLGPPERWPDALKLTLGMVFHTRHPMLVFWGPDQIEFYNDAYIPIHGHGKHPHAMGRPGREVWPEIWDTLSPQIRDAMEHGRSSFNKDQRLELYRDGALQESYFTYSYSPVYDAAGAVVATLVLCTETTAEVFNRREAERARRKAEHAQEELRAVFEQAPFPLCVLVGEELRFAQANKRYEDFVGRPVVGRPLLEAFREEEIRHFLPILRGVLRTGQPYLVREAPLELPGADGKVARRYIDAGYHPYLDESGKTVGVLAVVQDVTGFVDARHRVEKLATELQGAVSARDEFLSIASHELRTPITAMKLQVQLAQRTRKDTAFDEGRVAKLVESADRGLSRLTRLVSDMLDVARIQSGHLQIVREAVDLSRLLVDTVERFQPELTEAGITLALRVPPSLPAFVDPMRMEQIFTNLLTNAIRYAPHSALKIAATASEGRARIDFEDSGPGIPKQDQRRIFERFERLVPNTHTGGIGLGLYITRQLLQAHGGDVSVESEPEQGTRFILDLPLGAPAQRDASPTAATG